MDRSPEFTDSLKGFQGHSRAAQHWCLLMHLHLNLTEKNKATMRRVGKYAEFAYTTALNYLLGQEDYRFQLGDTRVVFWAESGEEAYQDFFASFRSPNQDNEEILKAVFARLKKQKYLDLDQFELNPNQKFYILGLAPNAARLSVRFFYEDSFENILKHLAEHYQRLKL